MPKKNEVQDFPFQKFAQLLGLLQQQDERGLILSVASFAEESLRRLILAYMRDVKSAGKLIDEFGAPLGTFSSRIATAYALGLISDRQFSDLEHLRQIRNGFAHNWAGVSFETPTIKGHIADLSEAEGYVDVNAEPRFDKVRRTMSLLIAQLELLAERIKKLDLRLKPIGAHAEALTRQNR
ncbi:MltR family transcriptional regulator [Rhizobium leguminosarum]|uniref:MltR family transcriptional regulator n=1 Tax=Rhizobium leguminosarum TaxID=384 RepID=UPI003F95492A